MAKRQKITWIGNKAKWEFHRIVEGEPHPRQCHLNSIKPENLVESTTGTAKELRGSGFDPAKFCTKKFRSRENT